MYKHRIFRVYKKVKVLTMTSCNDNIIDRHAKATNTILLFIEPKTTATKTRVYEIQENPVHIYNRDLASTTRRQRRRENGVATSIYGNMTPYLRHFHVVSDVASCLLSLSNSKTYRLRLSFHLVLSHQLQLHLVLETTKTMHNS